MQDEQIATYLDMVAATAKATADDMRHGRLWEGERDERIRVIFDALRRIPFERG